MQINFNQNINFLNIIKINPNNEKLKSSNQDNLKEQVANILKDIPQDKLWYL